MSSGGSSSSAKSTLTGEQSEALKTVIGYADSRVDTGATAYTGQRFANFSDDYFGNLEKGQQLVFDATQQAQQAFTVSTNYLTQTPEQQYGVFRNNFVDPMYQNFQATALSDLNESFAGDMFTTTRADARAKASNQFFGGVVAPQWQDYDARRRAEGLGSAGSLVGLGANMAQTANAIESLKIVPEQRELDFQFSEFLRTADENNPYINTLLESASVKAMENVITENSNMAGAIMGGVGTGVGAFAALSDRRQKENIVEISGALAKIEALDGYLYNYKANQPDEINGGVMAQDLEKVMPEAVLTKDDVKYVKYDVVIGLLVAAVKELNQKVGV